MDNRFVFRYHRARVRSEAAGRGAGAAWRWSGRVEAGSRVAAGSPRDRAVSREREGPARAGSNRLGPERTRNPASRARRVPVPQTDTGGQVEQTQVNGRPLVKELGNLTP
jgi:hypothetical protein